nr:DMT family transporter [Roseibium polysiphoniae]
MPREYALCLKPAKRPACHAGHSVGNGLWNAVSRAVCDPQGNSFAINPSPVYITSLVYLAIISSVVAFGSYLTLLGRIGSARAGYATVIFPVVALSISTVFEGYQWTGSAILGLACVLFGNILMLRGR